MTEDKTGWVPLSRTVPPAIMAHIKLRMQERGMSPLVAAGIAKWFRSTDLVPPGDWYKEFWGCTLVGSGQYPKSVLETGMKPWGTKLARVGKAAYLSPKNAELSIMLEQGASASCAITLNLGIPKFSTFSIRLPLDDIDPTEARFFVSQGLEAMLDEVAAFMITMGYSDEVCAFIYQSAQKCYAAFDINSAADSEEKWKDKSIRMYEGTFPLNEDFIDETQVKVVTASFLQKRAEDITQNPKFMSWFNGSKVVDAQGKPLRLYHGTQSDFDEFSHEALGKATRAATTGLGFFFTDKSTVADEFAGQDKPGGRVMPVYVKMTKPFDPSSIMADPKHTKVYTHGYNKVQPGQKPFKRYDRGQDPFNLMKEGLRIFLATSTKFEPIVIPDGERMTFDHCVEARKRLHTLGFDGIIVRDTQMDGSGPAGREHTFYIAFSPNQIKSAIGNIGEFSNDNHSITAAPTMRTPKPTRMELHKLDIKDKANSPARIIQMYRSKTPKSLPKPYYLIVYDAQGRGVGTLRPSQWETRALRRM